MMSLDAPTILAAFESVRPGTDVDYTVLRPTSEPSRVAHLAVSRDGASSLLVPVPHIPNELTRLTHGVALRGVSQLEFARGAERWREPAAVLECRDTALLRTFCGMAAALIARLEPNAKPTWDTVVGLFGEWERLFGHRRLLSGESEIGLWGELWCLARSTRASTLLAGWCGPDSDPVDFLADGLGIEVKTSRRFGVHMISQSQVDEPLGEVPVVLTSLHVAIDPLRGRRLPDLVRDLERRTSDLATFEEKLAAAGYSRDDERAYTHAFAILEAPLFYAADAVPRVRAADPGVSQIRYRAELSRDAALEGERRDRAVSVLGLELERYEYPCA